MHYLQNFWLTIRPPSSFFVFHYSNDESIECSVTQFWEWNSCRPWSWVMANNEEKKFLTELRILEYCTSDIILCSGEILGGMEREAVVPLPFLIHRCQIRRGGMKNLNNWAFYNPKLIHTCYLTCMEQFCQLFCCQNFSLYPDEFVSKKRRFRSQLCPAPVPQFNACIRRNYKLQLPAVGTGAENVAKRRRLKGAECEHCIGYKERPNRQNKKILKRMKN